TDHGAILNARGTASLAKNGQLDLAADWKNLSFPLEGGAPVVTSRAGQGKLRGTPADYRLDLDAQLAGPDIPPGRWVVAGRGDRNRMDLRSVRADLLRGRLTATGTVSWQPAVAWKISTTGRGLDPSALAVDWPGRIDFAATSEGTLRNGSPYGRVDMEKLGGQLRGNPLDGRIHLGLAGDLYRLTRLDLRSGTARATASGTFSARAADLDWRLEAPNLAEALPESGGSLLATGHLSGPWATPRIRADAKGQSIVFKTASVATLSLLADADLARNGAVSLDLDAGDVAYGPRRFETVTLTGKGTRNRHDLALAVRAKEGSLDLALNGGLTGTTTWSGEIRRLDLQNEQTGAWRLAGPAGLVAGTTRAALRDFCWVSAGGAPGGAPGAARLCAEGQWAQNGPWSTSGTIADLPFSLFKPFLPPDLQITGATQGTFAASGAPRGVITANVDLRPGPGEIRYPLPSGEPATIGFDQGVVRVLAGANGLTGHADLTFLNTGVVRADLSLPRYNVIGAPLETQTLGGRIVADLTNLKLVEAFVPDLENTRGTLSADLTLGGTVARPSVAGKAELKQAQVDVSAYGLELRQIEIAAKGDGKGPIEIQVSVRSGPGAATLAGTVALDGGATRLTLEGR